MNKNILKVSLIAMSVFLAACDGSSNSSNDDTTNADTLATADMHEGHDHDHGDMKDLQENGEIKIYKAEIIKEFPDAKLTLESPKDGAKLKAGENQFDFKVADYELAVQTEGADMKHCANSEKGQHIHFIVNNGPYSAEYNPSFKGELSEGNNVVLAFLSRSYHESIKNSTAYVLKNYKIGTATDDFDMNGEHLFYSRPKGEYSGKDAQKVLLDFYLINTDLAADGNKVKAVINGAEFILDKWQPYFVEGLTEGENTFRITLIDRDGNMVPGPFNDSGERKVMIKKEMAS